MNINDIIQLIEKAAACNMELDLHIKDGAIDAHFVQAKPGNITVRTPDPQFWVNTNPAVIPRGTQQNPYEVRAEWTGYDLMANVPETSTGGTKC